MIIAAVFLTPGCNPWPFHLRNARGGCAVLLVGGRRIDDRHRGVLCGDALAERRGGSSAIGEELESHHLAVRHHLSDSGWIAFLRGGDCDRLGSPFHVDLGPAALLLLPVFGIPLIHFFVSTTRMKTDAESPSPRTVPAA
ncbi:hypothetical protein, partial [Mycobacterium kansasii]|uniref:hypothetical protein n=1 Tax=Mycobacterium kansasii TaxID=1768 RepID=UPI0028048F43